MRKMSWMSATALAVVCAGSAMAAETKFSGLIFGEHKYYTSNHDNAGNLSSGRNQFTVTRIYVTGEGKFTDKVKGKIVLEGNHNETSGNAVFLKNAFGEYAFHKYAKFQAGMVGMPWIGYEEGIWGRRYVEKVHSDLENILDSSDLGIGLTGDLPAGYGDYHMVYTNGEGYKKSEKTAGDGRAKNFAMRLSLVPLPNPVGELGDFSGFKLHGYVHQDQQLASAGFAQAWRRDRYILGGSYQHKLFHLMYSYLWVAQGDGWRNRRANGWSIHASAKLPHDFTAFARYERFSKANDWESSKTVAGLSANAGQNESGLYTKDSSTYFRGIVGVEYKVTDGVRISFNDKWVAPQEIRSFGTAGKAAGVGGAPAANTNATNIFSENILYTQFEMKF